MSYGQFLKRHWNKRQSFSTNSRRIAKLWKKHQRGGNSDIVNKIRGFSRYLPERPIIGAYVGPDGKRYVSGRPDMGPIGGSFVPPPPGLASQPMSESDKQRVQGNIDMLQKAVAANNRMRPAVVRPILYRA